MQFTVILMSMTLETYKLKHSYSLEKDLFWHWNFYHLTQAETKILIFSLIVFIMINVRIPCTNVNIFVHFLSIFCCQVLGYVNMILFAVSAGLAYSARKGVTQFMARRFSSQASQRSQQSQNTTSQLPPPIPQSQPITQAI